MRSFLGIVRPVDLIFNFVRIKKLAGGSSSCRSSIFRQKPSQILVKPFRLHINFDFTELFLLAVLLEFFIFEKVPPTQTSGIA